MACAFFDNVKDRGTFCIPPNMRPLRSLRVIKGGLDYRSAEPDDAFGYNICSIYSGP
jgi:hypothetical protein